MIVKTTAVLVTLLPLAFAACSGGDSSSAPTSAASTSSTSSAASSSAVDTAHSDMSLPPTSTRGTVASTLPRGTTASGTRLSTTEVVPTTTTSPDVAAGDPAPEQTSTSSSAPAPVSNGTTLADTDCVGENGDPEFDLLHITVESLPSRYRLTARYTGDTFQRDILVSFDLGASTYQVTAELFEDGNGVARVSSTSDDIFLDPPQTITPGLVDLTVRNDQISGISGTPFAVAVSFRVDGSAVETCL